MVNNFVIVFSIKNFDMSGETHQLHYVSYFHGNGKNYRDVGLAILRFASKITNRNILPSEITISSAWQRTGNSTSKRIKPYDLFVLVNKEDTDKKTTTNPLGRMVQKHRKQV